MQQDRVKKPKARQISTTSMKQDSETRGKTEFYNFDGTEFRNLHQEYRLNKA